MDISGLVLKVGAYGLIRFVVPLVGAEAMQWATAARVLSVIGILYGGLMAFGQGDLKKWAAYSSISHMGWVLLAVFTFDAGRWSSLAASGAVMVTVASSLGTGALFAVIGMVHARTGRRELRYLGGLWRTMPKLGAMGMFFALAAMALPALGTFVGEVLVLGAVVKVSFTTAAVAAGGLVMSVVYALWMVQKVFQGPEPSMEETDVQERDLDAREWLILAPAVAAMLWLGLFPGSVLDRVKPALDRANSHQPLADTEANSQQPIANRESQAATLTAAFPHRLGFCARHEDLPSALPSVPRSVPADVLFAGSAASFPPRRGKEDLAGRSPRTPASY